MPSPTALTLTYLRREGWTPAVVERWLPKINLRRDLWGFGDVLAMHAANRAFLIVQATTLAHVSHRLKKASAIPELSLWLQTGGTFEVHGWVKRNGHWAVKRVAAALGDLAPAVLQTPPRQRRRDRWQPTDLFDQIDEPF